MMSQRTISHFFWFPMFDQLNVAHTGGRPQVVHDRVRLIESLRSEDVLISDAFVLKGRRPTVSMHSALHRYDQRDRVTCRSKSKESAETRRHAFGDPLLF